MVSVRCENFQPIQGVSEAAAALGRPVQLQLIEGGGSAEGYSIRRDGPTPRIAAASQRGLMYGLLDLAEDTATTAFEPAMALRSYHRWLPFALDQGYGQQGYAGNDDRTDWWWYDTAHWEDLFRQLAAARFNAIVLWNVHPFPALIEYEQFTEANAFSAERRQLNIANFRRILDAAESFGIDVVLLVYNIHVAKGFAIRHGLPALPHNGYVSGDTPRVRQYMAYCVHRLLETYPKLSGLMTTFEISKDCYGFAEEAILKPMQSFDRPRLHFRLWGQHFPEQVQRLIDGLPGRVTLWHKAAEELIALPHADRLRIRFWLDQTGHAPMANLIGPCNASGYNFLGRQFCDGAFIRRQMEALREAGSSGVGFTCGDDNQWINAGELSRYAQAMAKWGVGSWLMRFLAGRAAYDPRRTDSDLSPLVARQAELTVPGANRLLDEAARASRAASIYWRYRCTYHDAAQRDLGFHRTAGMYALGTQAFPQGAHRLYGPYATPQYNWESSASDVVLAGPDETARRQVLDDADEIDRLAEPPAEGADEPGNAAAVCVKDYAELNRRQARYEASLLRTACWAHATPFAADVDEAQRRLASARRHVRLALEQARQLGDWARQIPIAPTTLRSDLPAPLRAGGDWLSALEADAAMLDDAGAWLQRNRALFPAVSRFWQAMALTFELNRLIPIKAVHIELFSRRGARQLLSRASVLMKEARELWPDIPEEYDRAITHDAGRLKAPLLACQKWLKMRWRSLDLKAYLRLPELLCTPAKGFPVRPPPRTFSPAPRFRVLSISPAWQLDVADVSDALRAEPLYIAFTDGKAFTSLFTVRLDRLQTGCELFQLHRPLAVRRLEKEADCSANVRVNRSGNGWRIVFHGRLLPAPAPSAEPRGFNIGFAGQGPAWRGLHGDDRLFHDATNVGRLLPVTVS